MAFVSRSRRVALRFAFGPLLLAVLLASCGGSDRLPVGRLQIRTAAATVSFRVEIAETDQARQKGLMGRRHLASDAGMVFLFDQPTTTGFWMKDTLIPLDIAYWTRGGRIVAIRRMTPCRTELCPLYAPGRSYTGAVEVAAGALQRHHVTVGDVVTLERPSF